MKNVKQAIKQKSNNFIPLAIHKFSNYNCHLIFKQMIDKKKDKVKLNFIPKTNEDYIWKTYGCIQFFDICQFLTTSLDSLVTTIVDYIHEALELLKKEGIDDNIFKIFMETETLISNDKTIEDLKKIPDEIEKVKEASRKKIRKWSLKFERWISW